MRYQPAIVIALAPILCLAVLACGDSEPAPADSAGSSEPSPPTEAATAAPDPCLVPLASWESATGQTGLAFDRAGRTCDVLDDANARVAGSISLLSISIFDGTPNVIEIEEIEDLGDRAYWAAAGPGSVYVRSGDRAFSLMVNPHAVEDHREIATELARVALDSL